MAYDVYSRIKKVAIELHNFSFFHGPSEAPETDDRFVGREGLIEKLTSILTRSNSKSGAYLVTGYRGMGKTSFVNQVIDKISTCHKPLERTERFIRIIIVLAIMSIVLNEFLINAGVSFGYLFGSFCLFPFLYATLTKKFYLFDPLLTNTARTKVSKNGSLIHNLVIISLIYLLAGTIIQLYSAGVKWLFLCATSITIIWAVVFVFFERIILNWNGERHEGWKRIFSLLWKLWSEYVRRVKLYLESFNRVTIKINLGFEDLKEIDILKLVASHLENAYTDFVKLTRRNWIYKGVKLLILFLLVTTFLNIPVIKQYHDDIKREYHLDIAIPSYSEDTIYRQAFLSRDSGFRLWVSSLMQSDSVFQRVFKDIDTMGDVVIKERFVESLKNECRLKEAFLRSAVTTDSLLLNWLREQSARQEYIDNLLNKDSIINIDTLKHNLLKGIQSKDGIQESFIKDTSKSNVTFTTLFSKRVSEALQQKPTSITLNNLKFFYPITHYIDFTLNRGIKELDERLFASFLGWVTGTKINYTTLVYLLLFYLIFNYGFVFSFIRVTTHKGILKKIKRLNESINSQISVESGIDPINTVQSSFFGLKRVKARNYPIAGVREIEKSLIEIFQSMDSILKHNIRPKFIIIFDELDKIEPNIYTDTEIQIRNHANQGLHSEDSLVRMRQRTIFSILSNLKHFITTAKAKFIFIGGREMYDASLADVSDRNFFVKSIFSEIIYVDSFIKDSAEHFDSEVTGLTERYVCQFLIPMVYLRKHSSEGANYNLTTLYRYLYNHIFLYNDLRDVMVNKVMNEIMNFIVYLTYRSNGTPKKLTNLFDSFVKLYEEISPIQNHLIVKGKQPFFRKNYKNLFLVFSFNEQYTFGMVTYLCNPFFFMINQVLKNYEDKLLVSLSFMLDHIYKFHGVGFSWEDLESSPELVDIHKAAQSRELYLMIVRHLTNTQIEEINTGLFNFKFNKRIADEINILCRLNARESAAFNFTLDESLAIKQHYKTKLKSFLNKYESYLSNPTPDMIKSLSFLYMLIGDLHYFDEEYDDAILNYSEGTQLFGDDKFEILPTELVITQIKNTLKLGLAYEKRKNYDMALLIYGKLKSRVLRFGLNIHNLDVQDQQDQSENMKVNKDHESSNWIYCQSRLDLRATLCNRLRLIYQPFLSYFHILEKSTTTGIAMADLTVINRERDIITKSGSTPVTKITDIEFFDRIGDALFFKNGQLYPENINDQKNSNFAHGVVVPVTASEYYIRAYEHLRKLMNISADSWEDDMITIMKYLYAPHHQYGRSEKIMWVTANLFANLADTYLSFATTDRLNLENIEDIYDKLKLQADNYDSNKGFVFNTPNPFQCVKGINNSLIHYMMAAFYYRELADLKEYAHQMTNILSVLRAYITINTGLTKEEMLKFIDFGKEKLLPEIVTAKQRAYNSFHLIESEEYIKIQEANRQNGDESKQSIDSNSLSLNSFLWESKEAVLIYKNMYLEYRKRFLNNEEKFDSDSYRILLSRKYSTIYSIYNRTLELDYYERFNNWAYQQMEGAQSINMTQLLESVQSVKESGVESNSKRLEEKVKKAGDWIHNHKNPGSPLTKSETDSKEVKNNLIYDSVFCLYQLIRECRYTGISYDVNHSFIGDAYFRLAEWCKKLNQVTTIDREKLFSIISTDDSSVLTPAYNYEMALNHYQLAIDTHTGGVAYKDMIHDMIYLNDDYNDNHYHFCAALERYHLNNGVFHKKIKEINEKIVALKDPIRKSLINPDNYI